MTGSVRTFERGIALIVEGATEKMFYQVCLERCCDACPPAHMDKELLDGDVCFVIRGCSHGERLVMFHSMDTITQMPNAGAWFNRACKGKFPAVPWSVFLCYDADEYNHPVSKFREGDWARLREEIEEGAENVFDLAAEADIEDVLMCDYAGVLAWLLLAPDTPVPSGRNGKNKLRRLFQLSGRRGAYHAGERSRGFVESLDMAQIEAQVPFDLGELRRRVFEPVIFDL